MFTTAINKHIVFLQTLNFFSLCHTRDIDSKFLTDMRVCLYGYEVGFDLQYNPITRNIKHYVVTDEELSDLKITETTALIILLPVDGLVSCGHWALLYCFRSSNKKSNCGLTPLIPEYHKILTLILFSKKTHREKYAHTPSKGVFRH